MTPNMNLHISASLLRQGKNLDTLSTGITLISVLCSLIPLWLSNISITYILLFLGLVCIGLLQKYYALRVAFDADLFTLVAQQPAQQDANTQALDQALNEMGLKAASSSERSWAQRQQGALRLLRNQAIVLVVQLVWVIIMSISMIIF